MGIFNLKYVNYWKNNWIHQKLNIGMLLINILISPII